MHKHPLFRHILFSLLFLFALTWTIFTRPSPSKTTSGRIPQPQVGFLAPNFDLSGLSGESVNLADLQGHVVVLNFWASWCPPCRSEMPAMQQLYQTYRNQGLIILAVNVSFQDTPTAMQLFLDSFAPSYPILLDPKATAYRLYEIQSLPTTFFIGQDGTIRDLAIGGPLTFAGLSNRVRPLLQKVP